MRLFGFLAGFSAVAAAILLLFLNKSIVAGATPTHAVAMPPTSSGPSKRTGVRAPKPASKSQSQPQPPASKRSVSAKEPRKTGRGETRSAEFADVEAATPRFRSTNKASDVQQASPEPSPPSRQFSPAEGDTPIADSGGSKARQSKENQGGKAAHTLKSTPGAPAARQLAPNTPAVAQVHLPAPASISAKPASATRLSPPHDRAHWQPFWAAFNTHASARGFATDVARATGLKIKSVETSSGLYRVAFPYHSEVERARLERRIEQHFGLEILRAPSTRLRKINTEVERGLERSAKARRDETAAPATQAVPDAL